MTKVRKFCACGVKLERTMADEESARRVVEIFRLEHSGAGHGVINRLQYERLIVNIVKRNAARKGSVDMSSPRLRTFVVIPGGKR